MGQGTAEVNCACGAELPHHLAGLNLPYEHVCSCERSYEVKGGKFTLTGKKANPFVRHDLELPSIEQTKRLLEAAIAWKKQGSRSKWTTAASLALWDFIDDLERKLKKEGS